MFASIVKKTILFCWVEKEEKRSIKKSETVHLTMACDPWSLGWVSPENDVRSFSFPDLTQNGHISYK